MKFSKIAALAVGIVALAACANQPPVAPAYVEKPWTGTVPAAKPAFQPAQFTVSFASGKATLSKEAKQSVAAAAAAFKQGASSVMVTGGTDTVGKPKANQKLSERRANAVRAALVKAGVPANAISASGTGESALAVPTGDNVKEKANRRVVIDVR
jgi:OOP family OmpA-OmpF porin